MSLGLKFHEKAVWLMALPLVLAVVFGFFIPYGASFLNAFSGRASVNEYSALPAIMLFTVKQAFFSVLVSLAIGLPGAWFIGSGKSPLLRAITTIPFAMPSILTVLGFVLFYGNSGWLNRFITALGGGASGVPLRILYKPQAVILAHGFLNFPLVIRLAGDGLAKARRAYAPVAATLGASPFITFLTVTLPLTVPSIVSAALLVFLYSFTSFAVVLVLGGVSSTTLAIEIYRHARIFLNYKNAGALALIETAIAMTVFIAFILLRKKSAWIKTEERILEEKSSSLPLKIVMIVYCLFLSLFIFGPIASLILESLLFRHSARVTLSLRWWLALGETCLPALLRSLALAFFSASFSCALALPAAGAVKFLEDRGKSFGLNFIRFCAAAPIISSGIVLGLGWLVAYGGRFSASPAALLMLHTIIAFPFAYNSISEGFRSLSDNILNAALASGASPLRSFLTAALPLSLPYLRSAWGFAAALSLGELNAAVMLGWETLPLYIYRAAGAYRYGNACAAGILLILSFGAALLLPEAFGKNKKTAAERVYGS